MNNFMVGSEFYSFEELKNALYNYERTTCAQFYVRDSRKIATALKRLPKKKVKPELKYVYLAYICIAGGKFRSRCSGRRPNQSTFRQNCPAEIRLGIGNEGNCLKVQAFNEKHNHVCNEVTYAHLPRQRRLDDTSIKEAIKFLDLRCDKKLLQDHLSEKTGKVVTGRDISNLRYKYITKKDPKTDIDLVDQKEEVLDTDGEKLQDVERRKRKLSALKASPKPYEQYLQTEKKTKQRRSKEKLHGEVASDLAHVKKPCKSLDGNAEKTCPNLESIDTEVATNSNISHEHDYCMDEIEQQVRIENVQTEVVIVSDMTEDSVEVVSNVNPESLKIQLLEAENEKLRQELKNERKERQILEVSNSVLK